MDQVVFSLTKINDYFSQVTDPIAFHTFVSTGVVNQNFEVLACYVGDFREAAKRYEAVVKLQFGSDDDANDFLSKQAQLLKSNKQCSPPIVFRSNTKTRLHDIVYEESKFADYKETLHCLVGLSGDYHPFLTAKMKIVDVPRYVHFDVAEYPKCISYFMYGDAENVFLFHFPKKSPDFFQVSKSKTWMEAIGGLIWRLGTRKLSWADKVLRSTFVRRNFLTRPSAIQ